MNGPKKPGRSLIGNIAGNTGGLGIATIASDNRKRPVL